VAIRGYPTFDKKIASFILILVRCDGAYAQAGALRREPFPSERELFPHEREPFPREREPFPREREPFPREREPFPRERESFPNERESFPREREPAEAWNGSPFGALRFVRKGFAQQDTRNVERVVWFRRHGVAPR
jgi:hypothetical protein